MPELTQEYLKEQIHYNPETGIFTNAKTRNPRAKRGCVIGSDNGKGYLSTQINKSRFYLHRLAFLYMTGSLPDDEVDHINHIRCDNRWCNLRLVSRSENRRNQSMTARTTSGFTAPLTYISFRISY